MSFLVPFKKSEGVAPEHEQVGQGLGEQALDALPREFLIRGILSYGSQLAVLHIDQKDPGVQNLIVGKDVILEGKGIGDLLRHMELGPLLYLLFLAQAAGFPLPLRLSLLQFLLEGLQYIIRAAPNLAVVADTLLDALDLVVRGQFHHQHGQREG